jgi:gluconate kinase
VEEAVLLKAQTGKGLSKLHHPVATVPVLNQLAKVNEQRTSKIREEIVKVELLKRESRDNSIRVTELTEIVHKQACEIQELSRRLELQQSEYSERERDLNSSVERLHKIETSYELLNIDIENTQELGQRQLNAAQNVRSALKVLTAETGATLVRAPTAAFSWLLGPTGSDSDIEFTVVQHMFGSRKLLSVRLDRNPRVLSLVRNNPRG